MDIGNFAIIGATLLGPVLAVQAQKWIERGREDNKRREWLFATMMATRGAKLDVEHVRALNMIDLVFYGKGPGKRPASFQKILDVWREYHAHLSLDITKYSEPQVVGHNRKREELFVDLLAAMAAERGFAFDRVHIATGSYHPNLFESSQNETLSIRAAALRVLSGEGRLRISIDNDA